MTNSEADGRPTSCTADRALATPASGAAPAPAVAATPTRRPVVARRSAGRAEGLEAARDTARAMSQGNVEVVRNAWKAFNSGGLDALLECLDPEIEWRTRPDLPDSATYRGRAEVKRLFALFEDAFDEFGAEPEAFIDAGEQVVVPLSWWGRGKLSGALSRRGRAKRGSTPSATERSPECGSIDTGRKPSKPPGCGSRSNDLPVSRVTLTACGCRWYVRAEAAKGAAWSLEVEGECPRA